MVSYVISSTLRGWGSSGMKELREFSHSPVRDEMVRESGGTDFHKRVYPCSSLLVLMKWDELTLNSYHDTIITSHFRPRSSLRHLILAITTIKLPTSLSPISCTVLWTASHKFLSLILYWYFVSIIFTFLQVWIHLVPLFPHLNVPKHRGKYFEPASRRQSDDHYICISGMYTSRRLGLNLTTAITEYPCERSDHR